MSKKEETTEVNSKIKDEQLKELQELFGKIQQAQSGLGQLDVQKFNILKVIQELDDKLKDLQNKLEEEYGRVSIDIKDGSITKIEDEADKED
tara:strand:+ start:1941 stop:2216 length:276 start_codon:yes stop_codon:yes gene_type:complete